MNYTKKQLTDMIRRMGIQPDDSVMIHASMKSIGNVEGGADTVLDAWMEYLSEGLFMMPAHTWAQMGPDCRVFDPQSMPSCVGLLTNLFRMRPGVVRSLHPTHSIAAYGKGAKDYIAGEETVDTPCHPDGCWGRLENIGAKILLIGVGHERNTFIHSVEESMKFLSVRLTVLFFPARFTAITIKMSLIFLSIIPSCLLLLRPAAPPAMVPLAMQTVFSVMPGRLPL